MWKFLCRLNLRNSEKKILTQQLRNLCSSGHFNIQQFNNLTRNSTYDPENHLRTLKTIFGCDYTLNKRQYCSFHKFRDTMDVPEGVFKGKTDRFNGITVDSKHEYAPEENFEQKLKKSLEHWIASKRRSIWFKVETAHSVWIQHLTQNGFDFHHAKFGYVMLFRWLPKDEVSNLPEFCHTMLGVGGLVVNDKNEILVVSDRHAMIPDSWKLPGGYVDAKEDLVDAAIREVREETGIDCTFRSLVSLRHSHGGSFDSSDIYIVIALAPLHLNLKRCEREIAKLQWMPLDEYLQNPHVHQANNKVVRTYLEYLKHGVRLKYESAIHPVLDKKYMIYYVDTDNKNNKEQIQKSP